MDKYDLLKMKVEYRDGGLYYKAHEGMSKRWMARCLGKEIKGTQMTLGYLRLCLGHEGKVYQMYLQRAVYTLVWGDIPDGREIDHIDRNKLNNHPLNLRAVSRTTNARNVTRRDSSTGEANISWSKQNNSYKVRFRHPENRYEKHFPSLELAKAARDEQCALRGLSFR